MVFLRAKTPFFLLTRLKYVHLNFYKKKGNTTCVIAQDKLKVIQTHIYIYSEHKSCFGFFGWFGGVFFDCGFVVCFFFSNYTNAVLKLCAAQRHCLFVCTQMLSFILLEQWAQATFLKLFAAEGFCCISCCIFICGHHWGIRAQQKYLAYAEGACVSVNGRNI